MAAGFAKHYTWHKLEGGRTEETQLAKPCSNEPLRISVLDRPITSPLQKLILQRFTRLSQLPCLYRCIKHVLPVKHVTLQESYAANDYVSPRESGCSIQLDLGIMIQCLT